MLFGGYTFLVESVFELSFYFIYLDGLGIEKFLFPLVLYSYFRFIKSMRSMRSILKFTTIPFI